MHLSHVLIRGFAPALALFVIAAPAPGAPAADPLVERYTQLAKHFRDFENHTDAEINDAVFAGIHSENPKIVELTVGALAADATFRDLRGGLRGRGKAHAATKERDLRAVPGLRDFLVAYARSGFAEHGREGPDELDFGALFGEHVWRFVFLILARLPQLGAEFHASN